MIAFDLETVPDEAMIKTRQWAEYKEKKGIVDDQAAALHPVFGRVVCACGVRTAGDFPSVSICSPNEKEIVENFAFFLSTFQTDNLGGHNIKGFDIPFLCCKLLQYGIPFPSQLRVAGKKPWEINHVDTIELMQFGKGPYISLDQMCLLLGVGSPKEGEVNALGVWDAFNAGQYDQIATYCKADVRAWYKCYTRIKDAL